MELPLPAMIIGIGGAGARIARVMRHAYNLDTLLISSTANDLAVIDDGESSNYGGDGRKYGCTARVDSVLLDTGVLNPSPYTIRGSLLALEKNIHARLMDYGTFIMVANLAGRNGVAVAPLLAEMIKADDAGRRRLITFAIMPFGFEHDRLFRAGVALKRLSERSDCTIVVDNDSFLANNHNLSPDDCYRIANVMLVEVFRAVMSSDVEGLNMVSAGMGDGVDAAVKDALRMLYSNEPEGVSSAMLYIVEGASAGGVSIGLIDSLVKRMRSMLGRYAEHVMVRVSRWSEERCKEEGGGSNGSDESVHGVVSIGGTGSSVDGGISSSSSGGGIGAYGAVLLSGVTGVRKFDSYDPLSILPRECMLDWESSEAELRLNLESFSMLPNLE